MFIIQPSDTAVMDLYPSPILPGQDCSYRLVRPRLAQWADTLSQSRAQRVLFLIGVIWILNAFDLILTVTAYQQGLLQEGNPLARYMLQLGMPSIVLFKIGLVWIGSYPLLRYRNARITEMGAFVILIAYTMLAMHWSECYELYTLVAGDDYYMAEVLNHGAG